ncbi:MAG: hypothetical protein A3A96_03495 [Candidatus Zambryskibacteria bacterium RIFCSPLOWO2_01_FULL_39_39]|uniref:Uncharacterized protein n=1 Tax=Candidatus Zambryskibacteria bacterium RIFCSPLOWO2_01_FULL_39_39 TaxID=1802758 RepID=A0A1G2TXL4_9BACT|nr:MAG: hypothetical protein A2644_00755 [Candidatus Zambryskibacteria bacterium RIFCSPHIGHO2_01_FULL_39_63]OHA95137.1 MAG: hypothetical protein A3B88_02785 [Candidatus Zambryskibacteria bacterium RIFCSPHIGHO2_02_FULL_39_19]OHA98651.1 MAG: hypothetical protein A3F20_00145 [Candidatus Zambryskibacteria bacterium RIFCSPHIGHO2_12_FULL_39_21]OHB02045.1 MAG: hypothetical protein A3A96_03495 [Candidatus Zambryskibacteria bacterium RIFCSPLOWO2_01_FULL_39_39]
MDKTIGEFRSLASWFITHNSLHGFNEDFCNRVDEKYRALLEEIAFQFMIDVNKFGQLGDADVLTTARAISLFEEFKDLIGGAKKAWERM